MKEILIFISEEYADWEIAHVGAEIKRSKKYKPSSVSIKKEIITSMGGLKVNPNYSISEILDNTIENFEMLLLCGGEFWKKERYESKLVKKLVDKFKDNNKPVSAICDASTFLAYNGYLDEIEHTGNSVEYIISNCPNYLGRDYYIEKQCVKSESFITANGTASLEFASEIMKSLELDSDEKLDDWYKFFKKGLYSN